MKAIIIEDYCLEPNFKLVSDFEKPVPKLKGKQVLVKLRAASVNPVDYKMRNGATKKATPIEFPGVIGKLFFGSTFYKFGKGLDGSGIVEQISNSESRFKVGDRVCGFLSMKSPGSYAEYAVFDEDELVNCPDELSYEQAAAFPLAGCTVMEMYRRHPSIGKILDREGQLSIQNQPLTEPLLSKKDLKILIIGASGGTGLSACLVAKQFLSRYFNTKIYAVCSERNVEIVKKMGADIVIDYTKTSAKGGSGTTHSTGGFSDLKSICQVIKEDHGDGYVDIVLDCVGGFYYHDDVCKTFNCKQAQEGVVFTTISPPVPFEPNMGLGSFMKIGMFVMSNKVKSLSSAYPSFHFVFMDKNVNDMHLLVNRVIISNQVYKHIPLMEFTFDAQGLNEAHKQMESQRTVGKIVVKIE